MVKTKKDLNTPQEMPLEGSEKPSTGIPTEYEPASKVLPIQEPPKEEPKDGFWQDTAVEGLISVCAQFLKIYSQAASRVLELRKAELAKATVPVLDKYAKFGWGVEMTCGLVWCMVGLEAFQAMKEEQKHKKKDEVPNYGIEEPK